MFCEQNELPLAGARVTRGQINALLNKQHMGIERFRYNYSRGINQNEKSKTKRNDYLIVRSPSLKRDKVIARQTTRSWNKVKQKWTQIKAEKAKPKKRLTGQAVPWERTSIGHWSKSRKGISMQRRSPASPNQKRTSFKESMCWTEGTWQCSQAKHMDRHSVVYKKTKEPTGQWRRGKIQRARPTQEQHTYMRKQTP